MEKPRPDYDAVGIGLGDWTFFPSLTSTVNYDNNVFRQQQSGSYDWYFENVPAFRLQRKFDGGVVAAFGDLDNFSHANFSRLDLTDWSLGASGRVDASDRFNAAASGYYGEYHEDFESVNETNAPRSQRDYTRYFRGHMDALLNYTPDNWAFAGGVTLDRYDWRPTELLNGTLVSNKARNETTVQPNVQVVYKLNPHQQLYLKEVYDQRDFDLTTVVDRSSRGFRLDGGAILNFGDQVVATAYLGYLRQVPRHTGSNPLPGVSELDYGGDVTWYTTPWMTTHLTVSRSLSDAILPGTALSDDQTARLGVDFEVSHNLLLQQFVSYTQSRIIGIPRTDRYPAAGATARYFINHYASAELAYLYTARRSTATAGQYSDQIVTFGLNLHI